MIDFNSKHLITLILAGGFIALGLTGCGGSLLAASSTPTVSTTNTSLPPTEQPSATASATPLTITATPLPTVAPTAIATLTSAGPEPVYLDDRSDAAALIASLYNAINLHQVVRAYSYWEDSPQRLNFDQFQAGYQDTASVQVTIGTIGGDAGAGQLYWSVPVTLVAQTITGTTQIFAGCYILHLSQPAIQATPPFHPLGIQSANIQPVADQAQAADRMAQACDDLGRQTGPLPLPPTANPADISAEHYVDNRSNPIELLRSLFNAINRHEYLRAYSYWESTAQDLPDLASFTEGYSQTESVQLTTGALTSDAGAGQIRYRVPVTLIVNLNDGTAQTFVGCYQLHLANPDIQAEPPFQPLGIEAANVQQVANTGDTTTLLAQACSTP